MFRALSRGQQPARPRRLWAKKIVWWVLKRSVKDSWVLRFPGTWFGKLDGVGLSAVELGRRNNFLDRDIRLCGDAWAPIG